MSGTQSLFNRVLGDIKNRRDRILSGKVNCIPLPFDRLRRVFPGTEQGRYIILSANQKVGKSKLADYMYVYEPFFYYLEHKDQIRLKIFYFTLEVNKKSKVSEFLCHLLFRLDNIRISPDRLMSTADPLPDNILNLLNTEKYKKYCDEFEKIVTYIDDISNPTGVNKYLRNYALDPKNGRFHYKKGIKKDQVGNLVEGDVIDYYEPTDSEEYRIVIIDNYSNLSSESGMNKTQTIEKMSKYVITLRDQLGYIVVAIQHQAQAQEGVENIKLKRMMPSSDGLADCKTTTRDANMVLGLYSPFKFNLPEYENYDIKKLGNNCRFLQILEDRDYGVGGKICPLFFDGAVSVFRELPRSNDKDGLSQVHKYIEHLNNTSSFSFFSFGIRKILNGLGLYK